MLRGSNAQTTNYSQKLERELNVKAHITHQQTQITNSPRSRSTNHTKDVNTKTSSNPLCVQYMYLETTSILVAGSFCAIYQDPIEVNEIGIPPKIKILLHISKALGYIWLYFYCKGWKWLPWQQYCFHWRTTVYLPVCFVSRKSRWSSRRGGWSIGHSCAC